MWTYGNVGCIYRDGLLQSLFILKSLKNHVDYDLIMKYAHKTYFPAKNKTFDRIALPRIRLAP